jgi:hypothetical protein
VFDGTVGGFKGSDTLTSATSGTLLFATTADSSQIGAYAVDGSGLSANAGNYVFAQDPANATALIITPRVDPLPTDGALDALVGAIASALQAEGAVPFRRNADVEVDGRALCNPRPDLRRTQQVENAAFARAGAGIRLPSGVSVQ